MLRLNTTNWIATNLIYVDGTLISTQPMTNGLVGAGSLTNIAIGVAPDHVRTGNANTYDDQVTPGSIAHVAFFTNGLTAAQIGNLYVAAGGTPVPVITGQPVTGRTNSPGTGNNGSGTGSYIFFGVNTLGATTFQWYFNSSSNYAGAALLATGNKYNGANTANLTVSNLLDSDTGYYYVVANGGFGSVTSILASFTVINEPVISSQTPPGGAFQLYQNQNLTLSVTDLGQSPVYQWLTNGVADTTLGTSSAYAVTSVQTAMTGYTYQCVVTNTFGSATSGRGDPVSPAVAGQCYQQPLCHKHPGLESNGLFPHGTKPHSGPLRVIRKSTGGTLGAIANGTYADWNVNGGAPGNRIVDHGVPGALENDPDTSAFFNFNGQTNSYLLVPHNSPLTTLTPPFSIECWIWPSTGTFGDLVSQDGTKLNTGNSNNGFGVRLSYGNNTVFSGSPLQIQVLVGSGTSLLNYPSSGNLPLLQWHHIVLTYDGTNLDLYGDGNIIGTKPTGTYIPDAWDPLDHWRRLVEQHRRATHLLGIGHG